MQPDSEQVVQEEHPIRVVVSEAPGPITYSRTVSRNVILVSRNLNKCIYIEFLKVGKLTYKFVCFSAVSTDETYPYSSAMGITNEQSQSILCYTQHNLMDFFSQQIMQSILIIGHKPFQSQQSQQTIITGSDFSHQQSNSEGVSELVFCRDCCYYCQIRPFTKNITSVRKKICCLIKDRLVLESAASLGHKQSTCLLTSYTCASVTYYTQKFQS